jgi:hypothetical protein
LIGHDARFRDEAQTMALCCQPQVKKTYLALEQ